MNRREFLKKAALAGTAGIGALSSLNSMALAESKVTAPAQSELIVASNGEPEQLLRAALEAYGGLQKIVKPGATVTIKANFSWYGRPEQACNSNPDLLVALIKACQNAGAKKVRVIDLAINPADMCLESSGIKKAVERAGGEVRDLAGAPCTNKSAGVLGKSFPIFTEALTADCLINVPILKHHRVTIMTGALKSYMGLTPARDTMHALGINRAIVEVAKLIKPHLHILDAYRAMMTQGPQGPGEVKMFKQLILAHDPVAMDAYGTKLLEVITPTYLDMAVAARLGQADLAKIKIRKVMAG